MMNGMYSTYILNETLLDKVEADDVKDVVYDNGDRKFVINLSIQGSYFLYNTVDTIKQYLNTKVKYGSIQNFEYKKNPERLDFSILFDDADVNIDTFNNFLIKLLYVTCFKKVRFDFSIVVSSFGDIDFTKQNWLTFCIAERKSECYLCIKNIDSYHILFPDCSKKSIIQSIMKVALPLGILFCVNKETGNELYKFIFTRTTSDELMYMIARKNGDVVFEYDDIYACFDTVYHCGRMLVHKDVGIGNRTDFNYNYIDTDGNFILEDFYSGFCGNFIDNYGVAEVNIIESEEPDGSTSDYYALIDTSGKVITNRKFSEIKNFVNGYAVVRMGEKYNYIDARGRLLSNKWFTKCGDFLDDDSGCAIVQDKNGNGIIDKNGHLLFQNNMYDWISNSGSEGFWIVSLIDDKNVSGKKTNFVDMTGQLLLNDWYEDCDSFCNGCAIVTKYDYKNKYYQMTYVDTKGKFICKQSNGKPVWFNSCSDFHECGIAMVYREDRYVDFINKKGKSILKENFYVNGYGMVYSKTPFCAGFVRVYKYKDGGIFGNYIDVEGNVLSDVWFEQVYDFDESGYAVVIDGNGSKNLIDKNGKLVIKKKCMITSIEPFKNGYALVVNKKGHSNFIRPDGSFVSKDWYYEVDEFCGSVCMVGRHQSKSKTMEYNFMNTSGNLLFDEWLDDYKYDFHTYDDVVIIYNKSNDLYNMIKPDGTLLYDKMSNDEIDDTNIDGVFQINTGRVYIDRRGNVLSFI